MDTDTIVNVGNYCEQLLQDPTFQFLSGYFEQEAVANLLATQPHELKLRESIYARISAHREFLAKMAEFVSKKNDAVEPKDQSESIDDPTVHDIYKGYND